MNIRQNDANAYRNIRKILRGNPPIDTPDELKENPNDIYSAGMLFSCLIIAALMLVMCSKTSMANCSGLSPELKKAYDQLKNEGFDVSCRRGL